MKINYGKGITEYGTGVQIDLNPDDVERAIYAYLMSHGIIIKGATTVRVNGELINDGQLYIDPFGSVIDNGMEWKGDNK